MAEPSDSGWILPKTGGDAPDADGWVVPGTKKPEPAAKKPEPVGIWEHEKQNVGEALEQMRKPGILNKAMGGLGYATSGAAALTQGILGDPARAILSGAPQGVREFGGRTAEAVGDIFGPGAVAKSARAAPEMLREVPGAARAIGGVLRSGVESAEDILRSSAARRAGQKTLAEANAPPTKEKYYARANEGFEKAKTAGGDLPEGYLEKRVAGDGTPEGAGIRDKLLASDVNIADHPELYKNTSDMMRVIDRKIEDGSIKSFADLMKLQRELRPYVRKAKAAGVREGDNSDLRAATIVRNEVGKMLSDFPDASGVLTQAKADYKIASKMDDIDDIITKARRTNDPAYLQSEFRSIALDDYTYKNFTPAEQKIIDEIARDSRLENLADAVHMRGAAGVAKRGVQAIRGVNDRRMKLAEQLRDMIARGPEAQPKGQAPTAFDRINQVLGRQGPVRRFPYTDQ